MNPHTGMDWGHTVGTIIRGLAHHNHSGSPALWFIFAASFRVVLLGKVPAESKSAVFKKKKER